MTSFVFAAHDHTVICIMLFRIFSSKYAFSYVPWQNPCVFPSGNTFWYAFFGLVMPFGMFPDIIPFGILSSDYAFSYVTWHNAFLVCFLRIMPFRMLPGIMPF